MNDFFITLIIVTLVTISSFIYSSYNRYEGWQIISIISFIYVVTFGWGLWGCNGTYREEKQIVKVTEILKGKHLVVVTVCGTSGTKDNTLVINGYESDKITDTTKFYWLHSYNYFNIDKTSELQLIHD